MKFKIEWIQFRQLLKNAYGISKHVNLLYIRRGMRISRSKLLKSQLNKKEQRPCNTSISKMMNTFTAASEVQGETVKYTNKLL